MYINVTINGFYLRKRAKDWCILNKDKGEIEESTEKKGLDGWLNEWKEECRELVQILTLSCLFLFVSCCLSFQLFIIILPILLFFILFPFPSFFLYFFPSFFFPIFRSVLPLLFAFSLPFFPLLFFCLLSVLFFFIFPCFLFLFFASSFILDICKVLLTIYSVVPQRKNTQID